MCKFLVLIRYGIKKIILTLTLSQSGRNQYFLSYWDGGNVCWYLTSCNIYIFHFVLILYCSLVYFNNNRQANLFGNNSEMESSIEPQKPCKWVWNISFHISSPTWNPKSSRFHPLHTLRSKCVLTFMSEPELGHIAFHYPRLGNFISLFNKI